MKRINSNSIWTGIFHMGIGTVLAQLINIVAQPILTRLFSAETLGIYTYIVSLATIVIPIASLKLDMLIVSETDEDEAQYITDASMIINVLISLVYLAVITIGYSISSDNIFNKYGLVIYLVPVLVFTNGLRFLFISYNNRYKKYKLISGVAIMREGVRAIIQIGAGFFSLGAVSLSMGYALSPLFGLRWQTKYYLSQLQKRSRLTWEKFKEVVIVKGKEQILYLVPAQFINSFSSSLITISITALFSATDLGYYSVGARILNIPIIFITSNVSKVCYQKISENIAQKKPVYNLLMSVVMVLSLCSAFGFSVLFLIAPWISELIFGNGYAVAGVYIRCLCVMYAVRFVATSFAGVFTAFRKQRFELVINILLIVAAALAYAIGTVKGLSITTYLWLLGWAYTIVYVIMLAGYIICCKKYDLSLMGSVKKI